MGRSDYEQLLAESLGFTCTPDGKRGAGWCSFQKGVVHVWDCSRFWARADVIDDRHRNHQAHASFGDALKNVAGSPYGPDSNPRVYVLCMPQNGNSTSELIQKLLESCATAEDFSLMARAEGIFESRAVAKQYWDGPGRNRRVPA